MKRYSALLGMWKMHIKNTVGCHHIPSRMTEIKNSDNGVGEDAEKPSHSSIAGGNVKCYGHFRMQKGNFFKKRKERKNMHVPYSPIMHTWAHTQRNGTLGSHKNLYMNVHNILVRAPKSK